MRACFVILVLLLIPGTAISQEKAAVSYPEGYRAWTHVKSMVIQEGHPLYESFGGIHHIYANEKALGAVKDGKDYPDGAILIFDLLEAKREKNAILEGNRKVLGVMQKDSKIFAETGGWGFEAFKGNTEERAVKNPKARCFACHESQESTDFLFSRYRE